MSDSSPIALITRIAASLSDTSLLSSSARAISRTRGSRNVSARSSAAVPTSPPSFARLNRYGSDDRVTIIGQTFDGVDPDQKLGIASRGRQQRQQLRFFESSELARGQRADFEDFDRPARLSVLPSRRPCAGSSRHRRGPSTSSSAFRMVATTSGSVEPRSS